MSPVQQSPAYSPSSLNGYNKQMTENGASSYKGPPAYNANSSNRVPNAISSPDISVGYGITPAGASSSIIGLKSSPAYNPSSPIYNPAIYTPSAANQSQVPDKDAPKGN